MVLHAMVMLPLDTACDVIAKERSWIVVAQIGVGLVGIALVCLALWKSRGMLTKVVGAGLVAAVALWLVFGGIPQLQSRVNSEVGGANASTLTSSLGTSSPSC